MSGSVSLVGAGPGDPGLLTLRALDRLVSADVVYHDALVSPGILALVPARVRRVAAGKRRGRHSISQAEIERRLVADARSGLRVVRLKAGDPFVFGRGGEEALALAGAGVPFEIVPGISAGAGVPALAGIPLTHRGVSSSVAFVTAHDLGETEAGRAVRRRLAGLAGAVETLVVFMGGALVGAIRRVLLEAGLPADTPAAAVVNGTRPGERRLLTTLEHVHRLTFTPSQGPVLLVFGPTVALAETLRTGAVARDAKEETDHESTAA